MEKIINKPLAGTFRWLRVNGTKADLPEETRDIRLELAEGEEQTYILEDNETSALVQIALARGSRLHLIQIRRGEPKGASNAGNAAEIAESGRHVQQNDINNASDAAMETVHHDLFPVTAHSDIHAAIGEGAELHWYRLVLNGDRTYDNFSAELQGENALFTADIGYRLAGSETYDVNCEAIHTGRHTESAIHASGVLADKAGKILRGTIDFRQGCSGSLGNETEDVLLLNDGVVNKSVPVILCAEEDVEGNHGATIGRPDADVLYYMGTRGIDEEESCRMLAEAKLGAIIRKLPDVDLREQLLTEV